MLCVEMAQTMEVNSLFVIILHSSYHSHGHNAELLLKKILELLLDFKELH